MEKIIYSPRMQIVERRLVRISERDFTILENIAQEELAIQEGRIGRWKCELKPSYQIGGYKIK